MSLEQSLNIAINSLKNNQYGLTVVSHNIANINTEGYTKKRVDFEEAVVGNGERNVYGRIRDLAGSTIAGITDYMDESALDGIKDAASAAEYYSALDNALKGLEDLADSLGENGLNSILGDFYAAASNLEQFPEDLTIRQQYVNAAQNVCDKFNEVSKNYTKYQETMISDTQDNTEIVNNLLEKIAAANENYLKNGKNDAELASVHSLVQELSSYIGVTTEKNSTGALDVFIGDNKIVQGAKVNFDLVLSSDTSGASDVVSFSLKSKDDPDYIISDITDSIKGGKIGAYTEFLNGTNNSYNNITDMQNALNEAANAFATEINKIQTYDDGTGTVFAASITTIDGENQLVQSTEDMFVAKDGADTINASNISVSSAIQDNVFLVAAARIDTSEYPEGSDDWKYAIGNSSNVSEIIDLQNKKICSYGGVEDNVTLSDYLAYIAAKNGMDASSMGNKAEAYQDILNTAITNYSNATGVNLDEEIADMLKYQRAYEASARVFSMVNSLYDYILGMV